MSVRLWSFEGKKGCVLKVVLLWLWDALRMSCSKGFLQSLHVNQTVNVKSPLTRKVFSFMHIYVRDATLWLQQTKIYVPLGSHLKRFRVSSIYEMVIVFPICNLFEFRVILSIIMMVLRSPPYEQTCFSQKFSVWNFSCRTWEFIFLMYSRYLFYLVEWITFIIFLTKTFVIVSIAIIHLGNYCIFTKSLLSSRLNEKGKQSKS